MQIGWPTPGSLSAGAQPGTGQRIESAAREFEALLITRMLQDARSSGSFAGLGGEESSQDSVMEYAEQQLGDALASAGGLGLATLVQSGLEQKSQPQDPLATSATRAA
jgi:Rod binding domain-containing protein